MKVAMGYQRATRTVPSRPLGQFRPMANGSDSGAAQMRGRK